MTRPSGDEHCLRRVRYRLGCLAVGLGLVLQLGVPAAGAAAAPVNDSFSNSLVWSGFPASVESGSNVGATSEPGEPSGGYGGGATVWWSWTAPTSEPVVMRICSSDFRPLFDVYTGDAVEALVRVGATDNFYFTGRGPSRVIPDSCATGPAVSFFATAGETYRIAASGVFSDVGTFRIELRRAAYANLELVQTAAGPLARFVYHALPGTMDAVTLDLGMLDYGTGATVFPGPSFFGAWVGAAGPACSPSSAGPGSIAACVLPDGARAAGPWIELGDRDDHAGVEFSRAGTVVLAGDGDDSISPASGRVVGGRGDDSLRAHPNGAAELSGGPGDDLLLGSKRDDVIDAGPGNDTVYDRSPPEFPTPPQGEDIIRTRDGDVDAITCGRGDTVFIDGFDEYPNCSRVVRRGIARAVPTRSFDTGDGVLEVSVSCPADGPRVCVGTLTVTRTGRILARKRIRIVRTGAHRSTTRIIRFALPQSIRLSRKTKLTLTVRSRDLKGRPTRASGRFRIE